MTRLAGEVDLLGVRGGGDGDDIAVARGVDRVLDTGELGAAVTVDRPRGGLGDAGKRETEEEEKAGTQGELRNDGMMPNCGAEIKRRGSIRPAPQPPPR